MTELAKFGEVDEAYAEFFKETAPPARFTISVAAIPLDSPIEMEAVVTFIKLTTDCFRYLMRIK